MTAVFLNGVHAEPRTLVGLLDSLEPSTLPQARSMLAYVWTRESPTEAARWSLSLEEEIGAAAVGAAGLMRAEGPTFDPENAVSRSCGLPDSG